ncbi:MAG: efflux RND transporter periplasmic adaptor subunit [Pseudomonadota bacterium]
MIRTLLFVVLMLVPVPLSAQDAPLVKLIEINAGDSSVTRQFFGRVIAKQTVDLAFQVGGQVVEFPVLEGNTIAKDTVIAELDLVPFQLALERAQAQRLQADRNLERLKKLQGTSVSQVTVDDAETQSQLASVAERDAERSLELATLHAPFDALVAARDVANFSTIAAGTPVVRLHDMSELRVEIEVPEVLFQRAGEDPDVELWATFPTGPERYPLEVREFNAETSSIGQTFRITMGMQRPTGVLALPGSSVTVTALLKGEPEPIVIPHSAVLTDSDGNVSVLVFEPAGADEGAVVKSPVTIAPTDAGRVAVMAGVEPGQEIVASGAARLQDGQSVRRFTGFAN